MSDLILASQSKSKSAEKCLRLRWWEYEADTGFDLAVCADGHHWLVAVETVPATPCPTCGKLCVDLKRVRGWEPSKLNLPLSTGGWCHKIVQGLFEIEMARNLVAHIEATSSAVIIETAKRGYQEEVRSRGLELGLSLDGAIAEEKFIERTIAEQTALIEAFGWAYVRVRLPRILEEYEVLSVEQEETTPLSGDVVLQSRADATFRRRSDGKVFVYNLKTAKDPHRKSWQDQWQYDQQMMTEVLAVERRLGERVYGVIIDGFDKGERVTCWWHNLKEVRENYSKPPAEGDEKWQRQRSRLLYGYKCEETIPGRATLYDFEGTTRKGWGPFSVWEEDFNVGLKLPYPQSAGNITQPIAYWIHWLPPEQVEAAFVTLPPIPRLDQHVEAKVRQIVAQEREIREHRLELEFGAYATESRVNDGLDRYFPQSSGYQCQFCWAKGICWEGERPESDPSRYRPRELNHPEVDE